MKANGHLAGLPGLSVAIVYDDLPAARQAMRLLVTLAGELGAALAEQTPQVWRFDLLNDPRCDGLAFADAVEADLLVISATDATGIPVEVKRWLQTCLAQKAGSGTAVVALLRAEDQRDTADASHLLFVRRAAEQAGLRFFAPQLHQSLSHGWPTSEFQHWAAAFPRPFDGFLGS